MDTSQNVRVTPAENTEAAVASWAATLPRISSSFDTDAKAFSAFWLEGLNILDGMAAKADRTAPEQRLADNILELSRGARRSFLSAHVSQLYNDITGNRTRHVRVEAFVAEASISIPGLVPTAERIQSEVGVLQKNKDGHEIDQGLLFNYILADQTCGLHLCHSMLLPRREAIDQLERLKAEGRIDLGQAVVERVGQVSTVYLKNPRFLNAEDASTVDHVETAIDLALLDPETSACVLRGSEIDSGKYAGTTVFCTGINLTRLYQGDIPYLWYLVRDLGFINKMYRGLARPNVTPDELYGDTIEKPWIHVVEKFAIGGGCQYLATADHVVAADDAYMTLPARKEGIIPGVSNMRLPRFVGDRIARQCIMADLRIDCDSPEGRMICDEVVPASEIDAAVENATNRLTNSGVVSAASNRRAFRIAQEPLDLFRTYMAVYAREQAYCHFSPALISNLERFWNAAERRI